jgi:hypothetical protein
MEDKKAQIDAMTREIETIRSKVADEEMPRGLTQEEELKIFELESRIKRLQPTT